MTPAATYRVQLSGDFTFADAAACTDYLAALGVSHLYCSPVLQAVQGSGHGYDVVDPTHVNSELGGEEGLRRLATALRARSIELLVDIVPNHMATAGRANPWWWDLLAKGPASRYAKYFDVDWHPATSTLEDKVLLGVLGDRYGRELANGALTLERERAGFVVRYGDQVFPISDDSAEGLDIERVMHDPDALDALLEAQHYRFAYWRTAQEELNYRRFFTVDSLIGLRVENAEVFAQSHALILELVAGGAVSGLRIDHVDGLLDPTVYLQRLRAAAPSAYIVVEKILARDEELPAALPIQGTTGYDFIAEVEGLFVNAENEPSMTALYHAFTGETQPYEEVLRSSKREVANTELAPDLERLTSLLVEIGDAYRDHRDRTRRELRQALLEVVTDFGVYRTYFRARSPAAEEDLRHLSAALDESARRNPEIDPDLLSLIGRLLTGDPRSGHEAEFAARFQQFTPAVMAKGVEDTAFYRYNRLVSLNEVGGDPGTFGHSVERFHEWCSRIARDWPDTMLTLSTHDTKRSGDVRARLDLLSEIPFEWEAAVRRWSGHNDRYRTHGYPDRNVEYLAYQTLVGAWPVDAKRLSEFLRKAAREAKVNTSWMNQVASYEDAIAHFVASILSDAEFTSDLESFLGRNQLVALGRINSLAQTALLLTCPGVPDLYQGTELWDLSLVDPDNRRPVDFSARRSLLAKVSDLSAEAVMARSDEGAPKLWMIARLLRERARRPELFASREHVAICANGPKANHAVCFVRGSLLVLVPRLVAGLGGAWEGTQVDLPAGRWRDVLTGERIDGGRAVEVASLVGRFPLVVMAREPD